MTTLAKVTPNVLVMALGVAATVMAAGYGFLDDEGRIGPGFLPAICGALMALFALVNLVTSRTSPGRTVESILEDRIPGIDTHSRTDPLTGSHTSDHVTVHPHEEVSALHTEHAVNSSTIAGSGAASRHHTGNNAGLVTEHALGATTPPSAPSSTRPGGTTGSAAGTLGADLGSSARGGDGQTDIETGVDIYGRTQRQRDRMLWTVVCIVLLTVLLVPLLGFMVAFALMLVIVAVAVERRKIIPSLIVSVITLGATYAIFVLFLRVPLPQGILGI